MDEKLSISTDYKNIKGSKELVTLFDIGGKTIKIFNPINLKSIVIEFNQPIKNLEIIEDYLYVLLENKIQKIRIKDRKHISTITYPNVMNFCDVTGFNPVLITSDGFLIDFSNTSLPYQQKYHYFQSINEYLIVILDESVSIYKHKIGLIKKFSMNEFENQYLPIMEKNSMIMKKESFSRKLISKNTWFSIYNRKIYLMIDDRIIGRDLNFYIEDFYNLLSVKDIQITKFVCISNHLWLFDEKSNKIFLVEKNCEKILFETECKDFFYNDKENRLLILDGTSLRVLDKVSPYSQPFKLIEENIWYKEAEDEFDVSDNSFFDLEAFESCV